MTTSLTGAAVDTLGKKGFRGVALRPAYGRPPRNAPPASPTPRPGTPTCGAPSGYP